MTDPENPDALMFAIKAPKAPALAIGSKWRRMGFGGICQILGGPTQNGLYVHRRAVAAGVAVEGRATTDELYRLASDHDLAATDGAGPDLATAYMAGVERGKDMARQSQPEDMARQSQPEAEAASLLVAPDPRPTLEDVLCAVPYGGKLILDYEAPPEPAATDDEEGE